MELKLRGNRIDWKKAESSIFLLKEIKMWIMLIKHRDRIEKERSKK
jgi:hypothetical protein